MIDVNLINNEKPDTEARTQPSGVQVVKATSNSVELSWKPAIDNVGVKEYQVLQSLKVFLKPLSIQS